MHLGSKRIDMPRIAFISHTARMSAGSSHSLLNIVSSLKANYEMVVILPEPGELENELTKLGIRYIVQPIRRKYIPSLIRIFHKEKVDLVYGNNFSVQIYFAFIATKILLKPFIWHIRETVQEVPGEASVFSRMRKALCYSDFVIANSNATATCLLNFVPAEKLKTVYNGIAIKENTTQTISANSESCIKFPTTIINIGRISKIKNQQDIVEIAYKLMPKFPSAEILLLGDFRDPEYVNSIQRRISHLKLDKNVFLLGYQSETFSYLARASLMVHTACDEPQGRVILEAMAASVPVIAYSVGGIKECIIDGQTGFLVPFGDVELATQKVCELLTNEELRLELGRKGRKRVEELYSAEIMSLKIQHLIHQVVNRKKS